MRTLNTTFNIEETYASRAVARRILKHLLRISHALEERASQRGDPSKTSLKSRKKIKIPLAKRQSSSSAALSSEKLSKIRRRWNRRRSLKLRRRGEGVLLPKSTLSKR